MFLFAQQYCPDEVSITYTSIFIMWSEKCNVFSRCLHFPSQCPWPMRPVKTPHAPVTTPLPGVRTSMLESKGTERGARSVKPWMAGRSRDFVACGCINQVNHQEWSSIISNIHRLALMVMNQTGSLSFLTIFKGYQRQPPWKVHGNHQQWTSNWNHVSWVRHSHKCDNISLFSLKFWVAWSFCLGHDAFHISSDVESKIDEHSTRHLHLYQ